MDGYLRGLPSTGECLPPRWDVSCYGLLLESWTEVGRMMTGKMRFSSLYGLVDGRSEVVRVLRVKSCVAKKSKLEGWWM